MTDNQIEKALAHCGNGEELANCDGCPYFEEGNCIDLKKEALDYIIRLKAENLNLQEWKRRQQICNDTNTERIMQLTDENANLTVKLEATETDKANLERTIEELNEALSENGISVDGDGNIKNCSAGQIRKETAKEIYNDFKGFIRKDEVSLLLWLQAVIERYGVEL